MLRGVIKAKARAIKRISARPIWGQYARLVRHVLRDANKRESEVRHNATAYYRHYRRLLLKAANFISFSRIPLLLITIYYPNGVRCSLARAHTRRWAFFAVYHANKIYYVPDKLRKNAAHTRRFNTQLGEREHRGFGFRSRENGLVTHSWLGLRVCRSVVAPRFSFWMRGNMQNRWFPLVIAWNFPTGKGKRTIPIISMMFLFTNLLHVEYKIW